MHTLSPVERPYGTTSTTTGAYQDVSGAPVLRCSLAGTGVFRSRKDSHCRDQGVYDPGQWEAPAAMAGMLM
jgi:hypothetical protein